MRALTEEWSATAVVFFIMMTNLRVPQKQGIFLNSSKFFN